MNTIKSPRGSRRTACSSPVAVLLDHVHEEVRTLFGELEEWMTVLEDGGRDHLPKYDEVADASSLLDEVLDLLEAAVSEELSPDISATVVTYTQDTRKVASTKKARLSNAFDAGEAIADAISDWMDEYGETDAACSVRDLLAEAVQFEGSIEFPSAF